MVRCIDLAQYFAQKSIESLFVLKKSDEQVGKMVNDAGFRYQIIANEKEIIELINFSKIIMADCNNRILFNNQIEYNRYLSLLKENDFFVVSFDEFTSDIYPANVVIIPYVGAEKLELLPSENTRYLLGQEYFIFRKEFLHSPKVVVNDVVRTVFISMGGTDPDFLTEKFISYLLTYPLSFQLKIVFAQINDERKEKLLQLLHTYKGQYELLIQPPAISAVMASADMGIINSGLSKYETGILGLPCITVSNNESHDIVMKLFETKGSVFHLGIASSVTETAFTQAMNDMVINKNKRKELSEKGIASFSGNGCENIYQAVFENNVKIGS